MKVEIKKLSLANYGDFLNNTKINCYKIVLLFQRV